MNDELPRIATVSVEPPSILTVTWRDGGTATVDLAGWIATGEAMLAPLEDPAMFRSARPDEHAADVVWGDDQQADDLRIDGYHLQLLAEEQRSFTNADVVSWQATSGLSNQEAAQFLGIALSTWHAYKTKAIVPVTVAISCRAALRDPIVMQAHYRPPLRGAATEGGAARGGLRERQADDAPN